MTFIEAKALYEYIIKNLAALLVIMFCIIQAITLLSPTDNSDKSRLNRSGLIIHTDALTGCQYLSKNGNLVPRLDAQGKQVCEVAK